MWRRPISRPAASWRTRHRPAAAASRRRQQERQSAGRPGKRHAQRSPRRDQSTPCGRCGHRRARQRPRQQAHRPAECQAGADRCEQRRKAHRWQEGRDQDGRGQRANRAGGARPRCAAGPAGRSCGRSCSRAGRRRSIALRSTGARRQYCQRATAVRATGARRDYCRRAEARRGCAARCCVCCAETRAAQARPQQSGRGGRFPRRRCRSRTCVRGQRQDGGCRAGRPRACCQARRPRPR